MIGSESSFLRVVFVDFFRASDTGFRRTVLEELAGAGLLGNPLYLLCVVPQSNVISFDDGVTIGQCFGQTTDSAQGEKSSPLPFSALTNNLPSGISSRHQYVRKIMFADVILLYSTSKYQLQGAIITSS